MSKLQFPDHIKLDNLVFDFDLEDDLSINNIDLNSEYIRQPGLFAKYSTAYELTLYVTNRLKVDLEKLAALLDHQARMQATASGIKLTEKMAENTVKAHPDFIAKSEEFLQAQKISGLLKQAKDAIVQKRDMLKELGATQRQERASDISLKTKAYLND